MGNNSFAPYYKQHTSFIVKNIISDSNKTVRIFNYPIPVGQTRDLLNIPGVGEADIRASLLKGEILLKLISQEITIIQSDIDLLQFNSDQRSFLFDNGVTVGLTISADNTAVHVSSNQQLIGTVDGVNTTFTTPNIFLESGNYQLSLYYNGIRQILSADYMIAESGGPGTGYDTIIFTNPPDIGSYISADYYVENVL